MTSDESEIGTHDFFFADSEDEWSSEHLPTLCEIERIVPDEW
jgi:hypothetical protein